MSKRFPPAHNVDLFLQGIEATEANFKPPGRKVGSYILTESVTYEIYTGNIGDRDINEYHERAQLFALFSIDAASYIDCQDNKWDVFLLFEKRETPEGSQYGFAGYSTVYLFYRYPEAKRVRISQFIILPPYRQHGHGQRLLGTIYEHVKIDSSVADITIEDPSPEFQYMRDKKDMGNILERGYFRNTPLGDASQYDKIQKDLKLNKQQIRRCHEIYSLLNMDPKNPEQVNAYRICVKRRLFRKFVDVLETDLEARKQTLHDLFTDLEEEYMAVINHLPLKT